MLKCKNKIFNRFLFFSLVFSFVGFVISSIAAFTVESPKENNSLQNNTAKIQIQQREILNHLERIEDKVFTPNKSL